MKKLKRTPTTLKSITFEDYENCLFNNKNFSRDQYILTCKKHQIYTTKQKKLVLSPHDDKRIVNYIYIDTLPWGFDFEKCDSNT